MKPNQSILGVLDAAIADKTAKVSVIAYDFNEPEVVNRIRKLGKRVRVIIDNSGSHKPPTSAESQAETILIASAGAANVMREHMGNLQHNKTIIVNGTKTKVAVCGSTNLSWRGFFVQNNNAVIVTGAKSVKVFSDAFDNFWNSKGKVKTFGATLSAGWNDLQLSGINAKVAFSPHVAGNAMLQSIADDITNKATSSLLYSLAFLYEAPGAVHDAVKKATSGKKLFVYGISDKKSNGILVKSPGVTNPAPVYAARLQGKSLPEPFKAEPGAGKGTNMHHKFLVIDFDKPTARVYLGSYNFSNPADLKNGENLLLIKDRKVATAYMIEAVRIFDHYEFRVAVSTSKAKSKPLALAVPPTGTKKAWWDVYWSDPMKAKDRELFSK